MTNETNYDVIENLLKDIPIPKMSLAHQNFDETHIDDVAGYMEKILSESGMQKNITNGMHIAVTAGSRGIDNINIILREIVAYLKKAGAEPFLIPAMGSHGGATAEGQLEILESYGITEEFCGCRILASMETVVAGYAKDGSPVYIDKHAAEADGIIAVNRIKPHTAFRGPYESGILKMLTIGMGKQKGAESLHNAGFGVFAERIPEFAGVIMKNFNVVFGVAILENTFDNTAYLEVIAGEEIFEREEALLKRAFKMMPQILLPEADVLVVQEIGKNFSGGGMDPNISGRWPTPYAAGGLKCSRVAVLGISPLSHGNFGGLGMADVTTTRAFNALDFAKTYPNFITNGVLHSCKIPMVLGSDSQAIRAAIKACLDIDYKKVRLIIIPNTMKVTDIYISEALVEEAKKNPDITIVKELKTAPFDKNANLLFENIQEKRDADSRSRSKNHEGIREV